LPEPFAQVGEFCIRVGTVRLSELDDNVSAIVVDVEAISLSFSWCTWYKNPWFALHKKRTHR